MTSFGVGSNELACRILASPCSQRGRVNAFATQKCTDFTGLGARCGGNHNAALVCIGNAATVMTYLPRAVSGRESCPRVIGVRFQLNPGDAAQAVERARSDARAQMSSRCRVRSSTASPTSFKRFVQCYHISSVCTLQLYNRQTFWQNCSIHFKNNLHQ